MVTSIWFSEFLLCLPFLKNTQVKDHLYANEAYFEVGKYKIFTSMYIVSKATVKSKPLHIKSNYW